MAEISELVMKTLVVLEESRVAWSTASLGLFFVWLSQRKEEINLCLQWQKSSASSTLFSLTWCNT